MKNFEYSVFFEFFVIAVFVCHFVYLATSSKNLKIKISQTWNWNWYRKEMGLEVPRRSTLYW